MTANGAPKQKLYTNLNLKKKTRGGVTVKCQQLNTKQFVSPEAPVFDLRNQTMAVPIAVNICLPFRQEDKGVAG